MVSSMTNVKEWNSSWDFRYLLFLMVGSSLAMVGAGATLISFMLIVGSGFSSVLAAVLLISLCVTGTGVRFSLVAFHAKRSATEVLALSDPVVIAAHATARAKPEHYTPADDLP